jgi:hypothetical protein
VADIPALILARNGAHERFVAAKEASNKAYAEYMDAQHELGVAITATGELTYTDSDGSTHTAITTGQMFVNSRKKERE